METQTLQADQKMRWGGLLENPVISMVQRLFVDCGRVPGLKKVLAGFSVQNALEVGCGLGEGSAAVQGRYFGLDNSFPRIKYAADHHTGKKFLVGDATSLPFKDGAFDLVLLIDTAHHLTDYQLTATLKELARVSRKYLVLVDPLARKEQGPVSRWLYSMDRGGCFRNISQFEKIFAAVPQFTLCQTQDYKTFPGFYLRRAFIFEQK